MSKNGFWKIVGCWLVLAAAATTWAQAAQKPGLYEMTSQMIWQKSPMPAGMTMPAGIPNPFAPKPFTTEICLTQATIDRYGAPVPQAQGRGQQECKTTDVKIHGNTMTGTLVCTGQLQGQGTIESSWSGNTSKGKTHFTGTMQSGRNEAGGMPVEWTVESTSTYKGADCGNVKPLPLPESK